MLKIFCITDLIRFVTKESEKLMKWSVHEGDFFILYDAFVLIKSKGDDHMNESKQLLPSLLASHEWIVGRYTL